MSGGPRPERRTGRCPFCDRRFRLNVAGRLYRHALPDPDPLLTNWCLGTGGEPVIGSVRFTEGGGA